MGMQVQIREQTFDSMPIQKAGLYTKIQQIDLKIKLPGLHDLFIWS
jgi:hypothetical protein